MCCRVVYRVFIFYIFQELFGVDPVKFSHQASVTVIDDEASDPDNESVSSEDSSSGGGNHRLGSLDSNLTDEIMTALQNPHSSRAAAGRSSVTQVYIPVSTAVLSTTVPSTTVPSTTVPSTTILYPAIY